MRNLQKLALPSPAAAPTVPRQLSITFDSIRLRGMSQTERAKALARLANLLMQAAGVVVEGGGNDKC
jgi:hypothetical protein